MLRPWPRSHKSESLVTGRRHQDVFKSFHPLDDLTVLPGGDPLDSMEIDGGPDVKSTAGRKEPDQI